MIIRLEKLSRLSMNQFNQIKKLAELCERVDGSLIKHYWNILQARRTREFDDFCYSIDNRLVAHLATYVFKPHEAEISAMVHPHHRQQGIFSRLFQEAHYELKHRGIQRMLLVCKHGFTPAETCLTGLGATYSHSEYEMALAPRDFTPSSKETSLTINRAAPKDIPCLATMDKDAFQTCPKEASENLKHALQDQKKIIYIALSSTGDPVGKIHFRQETGHQVLHDFCVLSSLRGQGYGEQILTKSLESIFNTPCKRVVLDVVFDNERALSLYKKHGFSITADFDFWGQTI